MPENRDTNILGATQLSCGSKMQAQSAKRLAWIGILFACVAPLTLFLETAPRFIGVGPFLFAATAVVTGYRSERRGAALGSLPLTMGIVELFLASGFQAILLVAFPV